ncbi:MAG: DUF805 domain-containing protein [Sulfuricurvum sp.]|nr:DUF805 domain-containing protein [Sulfuricurvum sp.]
MTAYWKGRMGRRPFIISLFAIIAVFFAELVFIAFLPDPLSLSAAARQVWTWGIFPFALTVNILAALAGICAQIRRLHDINMTGWLVLLGIVPFVNALLFVLLVFKKGDAGDNKYGANPL